MRLITNKQMGAKPKHKDIWFSEQFARGYGVFIGRITPSGERLFYFRYTDSKGGRPYFPIGSFSPDGSKGLTVAQARERAQELSRVYRSGSKDLRECLEEDRANKRRIADQEKLVLSRRKTVIAAFEDWVAKELQPRIDTEGRRQGRKDHGCYTREQFKRHVFPQIGELPIEDISKTDLLGILDILRASGKLRTANVVLSDLKQFFAFAHERELIEKNPAMTLSKRKNGGGADVIRQRFLTEEEIIALGKKLPLSGLSSRSIVAVKILLSTACRIEELVTARWEDVHIDTNGFDSYWYLPSSKNQRDHKIHLSDFSIRQFKSLLNLEGVGYENISSISPWVFPNSKGDSHLNKKTLNKQYGDRQRMGKVQMSGRSKQTDALTLEFGRWKPHDLRRTAATLMSKMGVSEEVIHECQNHISQNRMSRTYIQDRRNVQQRNAFNLLGERLQLLFDGGQMAEILPLRGAA